MYYWLEGAGGNLSNVCPDDCSFHGTCAPPPDNDGPGRCQCDLGYNQTSCLNDDRVRLVELASRVSGLPTWDTNLAASDFVCDWEGVACYMWRVNQVTLNQHGLVGTLPPRLPFFLELLDLGSNALSGTVPNTWANDMQRLTAFLDIS